MTPYKASFRRPFEVVARFFIRMGFSPNGLTLFGLFLGILTCLFFLWNRNPALFGFLIILCGLFDAVDGAAARLMDRITKFGSYLDAMCDRIFESMVVLTAAYVSGHWVLCFLMIVGSILISYAKARAAMEVSVSNSEWPDFMERAERDLIFAFGLILWGFFPGGLFGRDLFFWVLLGLDLAVYGTLLQRILRAKRLIESRT
ncbi:MAG: CDP-alcohol phosphatidyltransferase family protein [Candidatus Omnitrophica bacterium]|nr:CDP-alcohol phosphatidyltransferase family protein [Candidatus Omnitrophota bacterium]